MIALVIVIIALEMFLDLYTKHAVKKHFNKPLQTGGEKVFPPVSKGFIKVRKPLINRGAILGFLKEKTLLLNISTFLSMTLLLLSMIYCLVEKDPLVISMAIVFGGGMGNCFERVFYGGVTDFLQTRFTKNIVFNLADVFILIGALAMMTCLLLS